MRILTQHNITHRKDTQHNATSIRTLNITFSTIRKYNTSSMNKIDFFANSSPILKKGIGFYKTWYH
jgi:hypothetical protein